MSTIKNQSKFKALSPIIEDKQQMNKLKHYFEALDYALDDKENRIKNIAVTGDYGSGKSTVIESYIHDRDLSNKTVTISFATFNLQKDQDHQITDKKPDAEPQKGTKAVQKLQHERQDVELSILQQLIYHTKTSGLPLSRFKRIQNVTGLNLLAHTITLLIIGCILSAIYYSLIDYDKDASSTYKFTLGISFIIFGICVSNLSFLKRLYSGNHFLGKVNLMRGELSFNDQKSEVKDESLLNIYLDEIVYFFEVTDYQYVVLEDLDRLEHVDIFIKLREINQIINASRKDNSTFGVSTVKFIYAIKDTLFVKPEDRTKFFDFILPIIPVLDHDNSKNLLIDELKRLDVDKLINPQMLRDLSAYLTDMRLVRNIVNEFYIYLQKDGLDIEQPNLNLDQLLALMVYKNLMPQDFADLRSGQGALYSIVKNYKSGILVEQGIYRDIIPKLEHLEELENQGVYDDNIDEELSVLRDALKKSDGPLKDLIALLEIYDNDMIYNGYFNGCLENSAVLRLCLKKGYIDHSYVDYISLSHNTAREVTDFRKSLNQEVGNLRKTFLMPLSSQENIEQALLNMDFEYDQRTISILNKDLITYLVDEHDNLSPIHREFLDRIFSHHFKVGALYQADFISLFHEHSTEKIFSKFMKLSHGKSNQLMAISSFIEYFMQNANLFIFWHMLFHIPVNITKNKTSKNLMYIVLVIQEKGIINIYNEFPDVGNLEKFLTKIDFKIDLEMPKQKLIKQFILLNFNVEKAKISISPMYDNAKKLFELVYKQHSYHLTINNIKIILSYFKILDDFDSSNLTSIMKYSEDELEPLYEYIHTNINEYITDVYLELDNNINESLETILYLLNHPDLELSNKQKIITKQKFIIDDLSSLEKDLLLQNFVHEEVIDNE